MPTKQNEQVLSKEGQPIHEGDHVYTPIRGGRHEGDVEKIVTTKEEADAEGVKNPPKVCNFYFSFCNSNLHVLQEEST